ncbi:MAG: bifunctional phosphopantothenoylcysteine decarboxylase/phosphopantothenate--cysteine ligase CoaBC [Candidatus Lokiarchaeota archaeon]|nr:bifunctional phosphopantothenoylcysteine decarboxylase/phosphopantothenate--cysteine ligase CoaBC [Candidatus Lokiarchaeota archaeon]
MQHTSKLIKGTLSSLLEGKKIALCITGSVAAVECVALSRTLMRHGAEVHTVMSEAGQKIIHPHLMEWATGNPVVTELTGQIEHVTLAGKHNEHVDLILIAPSTANTIGKIANGIDDTPVTTTVSSGIGAKIPVIVVPAMHQSMYDHPAVIENIARLKRMDVHVISPRMEEAKAKIPSVSNIVEYVISILGAQDLKNKHFIITAGPTRGWLDRVRFITNPSTGKMGIAITREILSRGGTATLILGPTSEKAPENAEVLHVDTTDEMMETVLHELEKRAVDVFVSAAAVLDYVPKTKVDSKMSSGKQSLSIEFEPTKKIIEEARKQNSDLYIVGFKVESGVSDEELEKRARKKIEAGICNLVVANDAMRKGVAFGTDTNQVLIVGPDDLVKTELVSKRDVARTIIDEIVRRWFTK